MTSAQPSAGDDQQEIVRLAKELVRIDEADPAGLPEGYADTFDSVFDQLKALVKRDG